MKTMEQLLSFIEQNKEHIVMQYIKIITTIFGIIFLAQCTSAQKAKQQSMEQQKNPYYSRTDTTHLNVSEEEWKKILPKDVYQIAREKGTEWAFSGKYWNTDEHGDYYCAVCGNHLFKSTAKFASSCGWPSFYEAIKPNSVKYIPDHSHGMDRIEVTCGRCDSHLGHIFDDGPAPTYKRFCMNSAVLEFEPEKKQE